MSKFKLDIVDVFAEAPLSGNQLAVVRGAFGLDTAAMQAMALEMNFSETTFVISETEERAEVRIFTPTLELPFAGHPTLGTAWVLGRHRERFTLDLESASVPVDFESGIAWMQPPPIELYETFPATEVAGWLDMHPMKLSREFAAQRGEVGVDFLFVGLDSLETLESLAPTLAQLRALPSFGLFAFAQTDDAEVTGYRARMFFESGGLREDPATGGANSIFAAYLMQSRGNDFSSVVDQGVEMGRPSRIYLQVSNGEIRVGGRVQPVVRGEWTHRSNAAE